MTDSVAEVPAPVAAAEEPAGEPEPEAPGMDYTPLAPAVRLWIPIAAAVVFASVGLLLVLASGRETSSEVSVAPSPAGQRPQALGQAVAQPEPPPAASPAATPIADRAGVSMTIEVRRPAWIRTTIDGRTDVGRLFDAGQTRRVTAGEEIVLRVGDAGAVFVSLNGSEARPLGRDGQVLTRRFGNLAAPAPVRPAVLQATAAAESPANGSSEIASLDVGTTGTRDTRTAPPEVIAEREILQATQEWFEAYFAGNVHGMKNVAASDFSMVDERAEGQRFPATMRGVDRGLQQVRIEVAGEGAVMSARLTERATIDGQLREYVSLVSGVWVRTDGRWRLTGIRFIDLAGARPVY
jgi:hypothetical protein